MAITLADCVRVGAVKAGVLRVLLEESVLMQKLPFDNLPAAGFRDLNSTFAAPEPSEGPEPGSRAWKKAQIEKARVA